jgi:hypothetical protein
MASQSGERRKAVPVSLALTKRERATFEAEARKRGLGLSTTIRALAIERADEMHQQQQLDRAMRWQTERMRELIGVIESEGFREATQDDIDAIFGDAGASPGQSSATG